MAPFLLFSLIGILVLGAVAPQTADPALLDLANRNADFGARLFRAVGGRTDDNVLLPAWTLSGGLAALLSATDGATREQLQRGLSLSGLDQNLPDLFQRLAAAVQEGGALNLQQGVALVSAFPVSSSFREEVQTPFAASLFTLDFSAPREAADAVDRWAQEKTGDRVRESVGNLDPQTQLLLATAAFYQARFRPPFNASSTQDERFYVDRYHVVMVPMMLRAGKYFLAYDATLKAGVLKLPMEDGAAMLVVLPDEGVDVGTIEEELSGEKIRSWTRRLKKTKLEVQLPRLALERSQTLRDALQALDISLVFRDDADISNMGGAKGSKLSQVLHTSGLSVDESSDDVTSRDGGFSSPPPRLTVNRPFVFVVYHEVSSALLVIGRVVDPTRK